MIYINTKSHNLENNTNYILKYTERKVFDIRDYDCMVNNYD